jgi:hypothetical protein
MAPVNNRNRNKPKGNKPDKLSAEELAADYGYALRVINSDPDIKALFEKAVKEQWQPARFTAGLRNTKWYQENSEYAREAFIQRSMGGADWEETRKNARLAVEQAITASGSRPSRQRIEELVEDYINNGWDRPGREMLLSQALSEDIGTDSKGMMRGAAGNLSDALRGVAVNNGLNYSNEYYVSAARSVNSGLTTVEDWERDIRDQAAQLFPVFGDKIRAGVNARDLASPYITLMQQTLEIDPNSVTLNDPYVRDALGGFGSDGEPSAMNLWDFQKKLRNDPRWMNTLQANNEIANVGEKIFQMFGLRG